MFELEENVNIGANIKVVGVGGGGSNAITTMIECGMSGVDFVVANTDIQALNSSKAGQKIQLGVDLTKGLGAGANPDVGRRSAIESYNLIVEQLKGSDMVFVTAGMGGGTGTGGAPIVAKIARELGALTIGVVTKPFTFEGKKRTKHAETGLSELKENVDALIVIPNQKLLSVSAEKTPLLDTFKKADEVLLQAVKGISDLINIRGLINLDFADIRTVMANKGLALMGAGSAKGENRAIEAATQAISSPLLENVRIDGATGIIINVTGGADLSLYEVNEASTLITEAASEDAEIIFGAVIDPNLIDEVRVTVIATGFAREDKMMGLPNMNSMQNFLNTSPSIVFDVPAMSSNAMNPSTMIPNVNANTMNPGTMNGGQFHQQMHPTMFAPNFGQSTVGQQIQAQTQNQSLPLQQIQNQIPQQSMNQMLNHQMSQFNSNMMQNSSSQNGMSQNMTNQMMHSTQQQGSANNALFQSLAKSQNTSAPLEASAQFSPGQSQLAQTFAPGHLPSINNVQESVQSFTSEAMANLVETTRAPAQNLTTAEVSSEISTEVSPIAATNSTSQIARDLLLAKAKAFRESQTPISTTSDKLSHPEQLTLIDEGKQLEEARKMARDILEVPAFIRKKQGLEVSQS